MANLNNKFKKILKELEETISDEETIDFVKVQMFKLYNNFLEELEKNEEQNNKKYLAILKTEQEILEKVNSLESRMKGIERDIYCDEDDSFEILCPYCNNEFEIDDLKGEVTCPECNNKIELNWNDDCEEGDCRNCNHHCDKEDNDS